MSLARQAKTLSKAQIEAVVGYLNSTRYPLRNRVILFLSVKAGLRAKEIANLTWPMVTDSTGAIGDFIRLENRASKGRTGGRVIPINASLKAELTALSKTKWVPDRSYVIRTERAARTSSQAIVNLFSKWYEAVGMDGWTTLETLRRIVKKKVTKRPAAIHLHANYYKSERTIQFFESDTHLTSDIRDSLELEKRVFVASNSKKRVHAIERAMQSQVPLLESIAITSETVGRPEVVSFIRNAASEALKYQLILASPTIGTGVDITFPGGKSEIDVVYGFCEPLITTHLDFDQQVGRVRHPRETKIWVTPRTFKFHASRDVIRSDLHKQGLFTNLLQEYDENLTASFSENDNFLEMASLIVSQQRSSKNRLRQNYRDYKASQGCKLKPVSADLAAAKIGSDLLQLGYAISAANRMKQLLKAKTLTFDEYTDLDRRQKLGSFQADLGVADKQRVDNLDDDDEVDRPAEELVDHPPTEFEKWSMERTRIELFYRQKITKTLIDDDKDGKRRRAVLEYERLQKFIALKGAQYSSFKERVQQEAELMSRFVRDNANRTALIEVLLQASPIFDGQRFSDATYGNDDLGKVAKIAKDRRAIFENLLRLEVRADINNKTVKTFGDILKVIGLNHMNVEIKKQNGRKIYRYQLDPDSVEAMETILERRRLMKAWPALYALHAWDEKELTDHNPSESNDE